MNIIKEFNYKGELCVLIKKAEVDIPEKTTQGDCNTGDRNTGYGNTGDRNTGDCNPGDRNTGDRNTGDCNTGNRNTGDRNTGYGNTGYGNTGNRNTGHWNPGDWNKADCNTGNFNTTSPPLRMFNKDTKFIWGENDNIYYPDFLFFSLTEWVNEDKMSPQEKEEHDEYKTTGGYLKEYSYKEAFKNSWDKANREDKEKVLDLPNFDADIFKEISGIDVIKELGEK